MVHGFARCARLVAAPAVALLLLPAWLLIPALAAVAGPDTAEKVAFNRDIRPLLSDNCFSCHGPDASHRQADLRLDLRDDAITAGAIVPGKPAESSLVTRILATDPDEIMPPPE